MAILPFRNHMVWVSGNLTAYDQHFDEDLKIWRFNHGGQLFKETVKPVKFQNVGESIFSELW